MNANVSQQKQLKKCVYCIIATVLGYDSNYCHDEILRFFKAIYRVHFWSVMAKKRLTKEELERVKNHAKILYTREGVTLQKDLAQRVGVSENTISKWIKDENWERQRASLIITKDEELRRIYMQITELNDSIFNRPEGKRFCDSKEADILVKLSAATKQLENEAVALPEAIEVLKLFINMVSMENLAEAKTITTWADIFIKTLLK